MLLAVFALVTTTLFAQEKTDSFKVYGNCGMCKKRIEKAVKLEGVTAAVWDVDTKTMTVTYDAARISNDELQKKIAAVGHDTEKYVAENTMYSKLPGCCLYERRPSEKKEGHDHQH
jgi:copper chaperone CopZ